MNDLEAPVRRAFAPALLGDLLNAFPALLTLHGRADVPPDLAVRVTLRLAELWRRLDGDAALSLLASLPDDARAPGLDAAAIRCAALLEKGDVDGAETLLARVPPAGGRFALLAARIALHRGDSEAALRQLAEAEAADDPEVRAEAISFVARARMIRGEPADADWDRLDTLLSAHGAGIMQTMIRLGRAAQSHGLDHALAEAFARATREQLERELCGPVAADADSLGPIPLVVHGAARAHADSPKAYAAALLTVASCAWRTGDHAGAWAIASYGARIGERRHGPRGGADLRAWLDGIAATIGEERRVEMDEALLRAAAPRDR